MNKLDELIQRKIEDSYVENYYPEYSSIISEGNLTDNIKEITSDVAIKFGDFCKNLNKNNKEIIRNNPDITTQELFDYFINNIYGK